MKHTLKCKIRLGDSILKYINSNHLKGTLEILPGQKKGNGFLELDFDCDQSLIEDELLLEELELTIIPIGIAQNEDSEKIYNATDVVNPEIPMGNIFSELENNGSKAVISNPDQKTQNTQDHLVPGEMRNAYAGVKPPTPPLVVVGVAKNDYIKTTEELIEQINKCKTKQSAIDPNKFENQRAKFEAMERKNIEESLDKNLWVTINSERASSLVIGDLDELILNEGEALNLSDKSAKQLAKSKDLISLIQQGYIKIISPEEAKHIFKKEKFQETSIIVDRSELNFVNTNSRYDFTNQQYSSNDNIATDIDMGDNFMTEEQRLASMTQMPNDIFNGQQGNFDYIPSPRLTQSYGNDERAIRPLWN